MSQHDWFDGADLGEQFLRFKKNYIQKGMPEMCRDATPAAWAVFCFALFRLDDVDPQPMEVSEITTGTGLGRNTVWRAIEWLEREGFLIRVRNRDQRGRQAVNSYRLRRKDEGPGERSGDRAPDWDSGNQAASKTDADDVQNGQPRSFTETYIETTPPYISPPTLTDGQLAIVPVEPRHDPVESVWDTYLWALEQIGWNVSRVTLTDHKREIIGRRIRKFGVDVVRDAFRGWLYSAHYIGRNTEERVWGSEFDTVAKIENMERHAEIWRAGQEHGRPFATQQKPTGRLSEREQRMRQLIARKAVSEGIVAPDDPRIRGVL